MKSFYLFDSYTLNSGDQAILIALIEELRNKYSDCQITIEVSHPHSSMYKGLPVDKIFPRILDIEEIDQLDISNFYGIKNTLFSFSTCFIYFFFGLLVRFGMNVASIPRASIRHHMIAILNADQCISVGGGFISTKYNYWLRLIGCSFLWLLGKKVRLLGQSIGPFETGISKVVIPFFLNRMDTITLREPDSSNYLRQFNIQITAETADWAMLLKPKPYEKKIPAQYIAICPKVSEEDVDLWFKELKIFISEILRTSNFSILIVTHTIRDSSLSQCYLSNIERVVVINYPTSPNELAFIYAHAKSVIAFRFHALILSASGNVPFIAIAYEPKFLGLLDMLDIKKQVIMSADFTGILLYNRYQDMKRNEVDIRKHLRVNWAKVKQKAMINSAYL